MIAILLHSVIIIYIGQAEPYNTPSNNVKELINEFMILIITTSLLLFTDYVPDVETQYTIGGWSYCGIMTICIFYNLSFIVRAVSKSVKLCFIKYYKLLKWKLSAKP